MRICERAYAGLIRARAEQFQIAGRASADKEVPREFWWAEGNLALEQDWIAGDFSTWLQHKTELKAFGVTFAREDVERLLPPERVAAVAKHVHFSQEDQEVIAELNKLIPSAALSYRQSVMDIADADRVSFRGPALELREALREVLDFLAPDEVVEAAPGFVQEPDRDRPTMKQKARFVMKKKNSSPEGAVEAVTAFEEAVASLTRAVYNRSSKGTHVSQDRGTVVQLRRYVVVVLHDILGKAE